MSVADRFKLAGLVLLVAGLAWSLHGVGVIAGGALVFVIGWAMSLQRKAPADERT